MLNHKFPLFKDGSILTKEMLEVLRDNTSDFMNLLYVDYSDGIINGLNLKTKSTKNNSVIQNEIEISEGILKHNNKIYFLSSKINISVSDYGFFYIKIVFNTSNKNNIEIQSGNVILSKEVDSKDEFQLGVIDYDGGEIYNKKESFSDFESTNKCNIYNTDTKYSSIRNSLISPVIFRYFSQELIKKEFIEYSPMDLNFALFCINGDVTYPLIIDYFNFKFKNNKDCYTNIEIYNSLKEILKNFKPTLSFSEIKKEEKKEEKIINGILMFEGKKKIWKKLQLIWIVINYVL